MASPVVLHVARDWVRPSESFVANLVASVQSTRSVVAFGRRWPGAPPGVAAVDLSRGPGMPDPWRRSHRRLLEARLAGVARRRRAALIHAHFGYWAAHAGLVAARLPRPWTVALHGHDLLVEDRDDPRAEVLRTADLVIVPSAFLADAASDAGFDDRRIRVLPSGIDTSAWPFRERAAGGPVAVTFAGRFVEKKGVLDAVEAMRIAGRRDGSWRFRFVGSGPLEADLRRSLAESAVSAEVIDGSRPGAIRDVLIDTDLLLMPSRTAPDGDAETLGIVALEAQGCGIPIIATRHGGLVDAVGDGAGVFVPEAQPAAMADALIDLATHPEFWASMGRAGRKHVERRFELRDRVAAVEAEWLRLIVDRAAVQQFAT